MNYQSSLLVALIIIGIDSSQMQCKSNLTHYFDCDQSCPGSRPVNRFELSPAQCKCETKNCKIVCGTQAHPEQDFVKANEKCRCIFEVKFPDTKHTYNNTTHKLSGNIVCAQACKQIADPTHCLFYHGASINGPFADGFWQTECVLEK